MTMIEKKLEIKFVPFEAGYQSESVVNFEIFTVDDDELIGYAEGHLTRDKHLISVINIFGDYKQKGIGACAFKHLIDSLGGVTKIKGLIGSWHSDGEFKHLDKGMSTNLLVFKTQTEKGLSKEEAALLTPSGKWAISLGFSKVIVRSVFDDRVSVLFTRP